MPDVETIFLIQQGGHQQNERQKATVNAHVARHSHRERRARQLPKSFIRVDQKLRHDSEPEDSEHGVQSVRMFPPCKQVLMATCAPSLFARYFGNSDPFSSLPVLIDARANYYLSVGHHELGTFTRNLGPFPGFAIAAGHPVLKIGGGSGDPTSGHFDGKDLFGGQLSLERFADLPPEWTTALVYSVLAFCASAVSKATTDQQDSVRALGYANKALQGLLKCIKTSDRSRIPVEELVFRLLRADYMAGNFSSAKVHSAFLQQGFEKSVEMGTFNIEALLLAVHDDNAISFVTMSRPRFKSAWLSTVCAEFWKQLALLCPTDDYLLTYLAPTSKVQDILITANVYFRQGDRLREENIQWTRDNWHWTVSRRLYLHNCLIDYYVILTQPAEDVHDLDSLLEQSLLLTLYFEDTYRSTYSKVGKTAMLPGTKRLYVALGTAFMGLEHRAQEPWFRSHIYAVLWISFVMALTEHKYQDHIVVSEMPWFIRLRRFIQKAGLRSWWQLHRILQMFPYSEETVPLPHDHWLDGAFAGDVRSTATRQVKSGGTSYK